MENDPVNMLELLRANKGFRSPERWIEYAVEHNFKRVAAEQLENCPDCGEYRFSHLGQYVYYSTLHELRLCSYCGLVFSDTRIDPQIIRGHFEQVYKDEEYFSRRRRRIFEKIASLIEKTAPPGASVLDIGGAKGHLLGILRQRRPDLNLVLNDLSREACVYSQDQYGLETVCGDVESLEQISRCFDVLIMSDVIYYEPELNRLWALVSRIVAESGIIIIRVPNLSVLIKFGCVIKKFFASRESVEMQDRIRFFNPEHLYVFSHKYLMRRLQEMGFRRVEVMPSPLLGDTKDFRHVVYYYIAKTVSKGLRKNLIITPSMLVVATRQS
ncbi:MAG: class I SAM-dependent methyltransferase [Nitrospiraceae bacterium]